MLYYFQVFVYSYYFQEHDGKVSIDGRIITYLRFANDIAEEEQELEAQDESLDKIRTRFKMEIGAEKDQTNDKQRQWHPEGNQS